MGRHALVTFEELDVMMAIDRRPLKRYVAREVLAALLRSQFALDSP
jgi:hypothetical protein